jgi:hypothetical protein
VRRGSTDEWDLKEALGTSLDFGPRPTGVRVGSCCLAPRTGRDSFTAMTTFVSTSPRCSPSPSGTCQASCLVSGRGTGSRQTRAGEGADWLRPQVSLVLPGACLRSRAVDHASVIETERSERAKYKAARMIQHGTASSGPWWRPVEPPKSVSRAPGVNGATPAVASASAALWSLCRQGRGSTGGYVSECQR